MTDKPLESFKLAGQVKTVLILAKKEREVKGGVL